MAFRRKYMMLLSSIIPAILNKLQLRATYYENQTCTTATLTAIEKIQ